MRDDEPRWKRWAKIAAACMAPATEALRLLHEIMKGPWPHL